jgi:hypothetical protein
MVRGAIVMTPAPFVDSGRERVVPSWTARFRKDIAVVAPDFFSKLDLSSRGLQPLSHS